MNEKVLEPIFPQLKDSLQKESPEISCESVLDGNGWILKNTLTEKECKSMIQLTEKLGYEDAESYCFMYRDRLNDRIMTDDPGLADFLWERVKPFVPDEMKAFARNWKVSKLNTRFRICRYRGGIGHHFGPHADGIYPETDNRRSILTCMFYLNDSSEFEGGFTNFLEYGTKKVSLSIAPSPGLCLVFRQRDVEHCLHEGTAVLKGLKYILRTDIMFDAVGS
jgi:hypothetical protein